MCYMSVIDKTYICYISDIEDDSYMCSICVIDTCMYLLLSNITHLLIRVCIYYWVTSRILLSRGTHGNRSCLIYEWILSSIWMSHGTHCNESCHTYEWVVDTMAHIAVSVVTRMSEYSRQNERVSSRRLQITWRNQMSHVTHMNESCYTWQSVMSHIRISHVALTNETWLIYRLHGANGNESYRT